MQKNEVAASIPPASAASPLLSRMEEIRKRLGCATPGPWESRIADPFTGWDVLARQGPIQVRPAKAAGSADADFIAHAPSDVAYLLAELASTLQSAQAEEREACAALEPFAKAADNEYAAPMTNIDGTFHTIVSPFWGSAKTSRHQGDAMTHGERDTPENEILGAQRKCVTEPELLARLKASVAQRDALSPLERAIYDTKQKRSGMIGLSKMSTPREVIEAQIDKMPEFVILKAYEDAISRAQLAEAQSAAMAEALKPFAEMATTFVAWRDTEKLSLVSADAEEGVHIDAFDVADLRLARSALSPLSQTVKAWMALREAMEDVCMAHTQRCTLSKQHHGTSCTCGVEKFEQALAALRAVEGK